MVAATTSKGFAGGLALFAILATSQARAVDTSIHETLPYATARLVLLQRGFHPFVMPGAATCDEANPRCFPELVSCIHKRHWICDYTWRSGKAIYQAETNSDTPIVDSFYCLVNCTPPKDDEPADQP